MELKIHISTAFFHEQYHIDTMPFLTCKDDCASFKLRLLLAYTFADGIL